MAKILVVDDNAIMRKNVLFMLRRDNHTILEAEDGPVGIAIARAEKPDLVLLDVMLPYMSGEAVAKYFCEHDDLCSIPIIMITALSQKEIIMNMLKLGIQGYLLKPINRDTLRERVNAVLGEPKPVVETETRLPPRGETEAEALAETERVSQPQS